MLSVEESRYFQIFQINGDDNDDVFPKYEKGLLV